MKQYEEVFFSVVRAALWKTPVVVPEGFDDWSKVLKLAKAQTLTGLVADVLLGNAEIRAQLPEQAVAKLQSEVRNNMLMHNLLNNTLILVVSKLSENGVESVLLKGQGIARNYPVPELRQCGDIDLYVGQEKFEKACEVIGAMSSPEDHQGDIPSLKHFHTRIGSAFIEIHRYTDVYFQRWRDRFYQKVSDRGMSTDLVPLEFGGVSVMSPSFNFNVFFIFNHFWHHFIADGVGLRQLCDWVRLLHECYGKIDLEYLSEVLRGMGLMKEWKVFGYIAVNTLGLPAAEMPFYDGKYEKLAGKVLDLIMLEGNFGKENLRGHNRPKGYIAGKLYSFSKRFKRNFRVLRLFPKEALRQLLKVFFVGIAVVFSDKFAKYND